MTDSRASDEAFVWNALNDLIADHPMWIGDDGDPLDYLPEREARIHAFIEEAAKVIGQGIATTETATNELRVAALAHAVEHYRGPDDDTIPVLYHWLRELRAESEESAR